MNQDQYLSLLLFNIQNLFITPYTVDRKYPTPPPKSLEKVKGIAKIILGNKPDIIMLVEVGGEDSINNFNNHFLNGAYLVSLIEGNSDRGIELAFLIKKGLSFRYEHLTHRNRPLDFNYKGELDLNPLPIHYLSRDISELRFFEKESHLDSVPKFIILLVHLKSKLDKDGIDKEGIARREAELKKLIQTYNILLSRYKNQVPIFIAGDFNGNASKNNTDSEFSDIYNKTELQDFMELAGIPHEERFSFIHFKDHYTGEKQQLDYIFIPPNLESHIIKEKSGVYRFRDEDGRLLSIPTNRSMLYTLPSDHYPLFLSLKNFS